MASTWTREGTDDYTNNTSGGTSFTVSAANVGDLRVFMFHEIQAGVHITSISGAGVGEFNTVTGVLTSTATNGGGWGTNSTIECWYGWCSGSGTTLSVSYSASMGSNPVRMYAQRFRPTLASKGPQCSYPSIQTQHSFNDTNNSVTAIDWTSITARNYGTQLAVGYAFSGTSPSAGSTSGYTYTLDGNSNLRIWDTTVGNGIAQAPTATQTSGAGYSAVLCLFGVLSIPDLNPYSNSPQRAALY